MNVNIKNNTGYSSIKVIYNGNDAVLKKHETITFDVDIHNFKLDVFVLEKNSVLLNIPFALIDGFIDESGVINSLNCNATFDLQISENDNIITVEQIEARNDKQGIIYQSVYLKNDKNVIAATDYKLTNIEKQRKKSMFYLVFITSWLPVLFILLGVFLYYGNIFAPISFIFILIFFAIPSWKKAARLKMYYDSQYANKLLFEKIQNIINNVQDIPNDFVGKAVYKTLDKIFKKNRKD